MKGSFARRGPGGLPCVLVAAVILCISRAGAEGWGVSGALAATPVLARGLPGVGVALAVDRGASRRTSIEGGIDAVMNPAYLSGESQGETQARYRLAGFVVPMEGLLHPRVGLSVGLLHRSFVARDDELAVHLGLHLQAVLQPAGRVAWFAEAMPTTILGDLSSGRSYDGTVVFRLGARLPLGD